MAGDARDALAALIAGAPQDGAYSGLRQSPIDPVTGNVVASAGTRDPSAAALAGAYLDLMVSRARDAVTAPRDALAGDLQVFDPATGHVSDAAMDRANGMAGLAMTGSLPMRAPRGALRSFGGASKKEDPLAALEAGLDDFLAKYPNPKTEAQITAELAAKGPSFGGEPMPSREIMRLDPNAKAWDLYHGSEPGPDFARFDPQMAGIPSERGAVFFAPNPESANGYARATQGGAEAGSRVYRTSVEPGRTAVFDLPHLAETDPAFNARARQLMTDDNGAWAGAHHDSYMDMFRNSRAEDARVAQQMAEMGLPPDPNAGTTLSYGHGHIGAAIERAKAQGLDTAILRGLAEHGGDDQVVALTPNRVRSYYSPDHVLYSGGPGGAAPALAAGSATPDDQSARDQIARLLISRQ